VERADKILIELGLLKTRSQAKMLIEQGDITCNGVIIKKASQLVNREDKFVINEAKIFVGRGAYKLEKALDEFKVDVAGKVVADVGASTGGFTQVVLLRGASKVYCIDVGHDQLALELRADPRVVNQEGVNIKYPLELEEKVDVCVVDLSFISLRLVFQNIYNLLKEGGEIIALLKPQFEAGKERIGKNGVVAEELVEVIKDEMINWFKENNFKLKSIIDSPISGKTGNKEFLLHFV